MAEITTLLWDVGGVLLTNGWDRRSRRRAAERFSLAWEEFSERHELVVPAFETGRMSLEEYLDRTVFYRSRPFGPEEFKAFMFEQSQSHPETLRVAERLARAGRHRMATLNNESLELNLYRIQRFGLRSLFGDFFSSCFLGVRKPDREMYTIALQILQRDPQECVFIDDREVNLECARAVGLTTIHYRTPEQLLTALARAGVEPGT